VRCFVAPELGLSLMYFDRLLKCILSLASLIITQGTLYIIVFIIEDV
jgi:hypothetical protein